MTGPSDTIRVLHVDDDPSFRETVASALASRDDRFSVRTASTVAGGLAALSDRDIDCVVAEYAMPDRDGLDFLKAVRESDPDLPFLLVTDEGSEAVAAAAVSLGVTSYLRKDRADRETVLADRIVDAVDQYRAKRRASSMERRYRALFERTDEAITRVEFAEGTPVIREANPAFEETFDPPEEYVGSTLDEIIASGDRREAVREHSQVVQAGQSASACLTLETADGPRPLAVQSFPVRATEADEFNYGFVVCTEPADDEGDQERLQVFVEQSTDIITVLSADGTIEYESPSVRRVLGYDPADLVGENAFDYVHPDDHETIIESFERAVDDPERSPTVEYRFQHADGSWKWVESRGNNQLDNPAVEGFVVNTRDISDRVARERELERVRNRMEFALRSTDATVWDWNVTKDSATFYPSEEELYGTTVDSFDDFLELVHPEDRQTVRDSVEHALETGEPKEEVVRIVHDGEVRWIEAPGQPMENDGTTRMIGVVRDITEQKETEQEIQRKNERLEEFASVVSHDLRNPLNVAQGRLELAAERCDSEHLDHVQQAHDRMASLIDDLLTLAREGAAATDPEPVPLADCSATCWQNVDTADATLVTDTEQTITADASQLRRLFENLFRNAVEHGSTTSQTEADDAVEGESVRVTVGALDDGFYVEDDGTGIPEDEQDDVLTAGYSRKQDGTGFGLSIVKEVAEGHGWEIRVTTGSEGGARFEITGVETVTE